VQASVVMVSASSGLAKFEKKIVFLFHIKKIGYLSVRSKSKRMNKSKVQLDISLMKNIQTLIAS
jgi:hypothetical protein